jgi:membrane protein implicated in regulation of membrane protease activity
LTLDIPLNTFWFAFGVLLIVLEVMLIPGIGSIFAGLGAVTVGGFLLAGGWIDTISSQFIVFFFSTGFWVVLLWKPLNKFMGGEKIPCLTI